MSKEERITTGTNARPERYLRIAAFLLLAASVVMLGFILLLLVSREWMSALGAALAGLGFLLAGASIGSVAEARSRLRRLRELHDRINALSAELAEIKKRMEGGKGE